MAKIIVLDDEPSVCKVIKCRLTRDGHEVRISNTGDEAIDLGYLFQPDLLITDWNLESDYDGLEVAEAVSVAKENVKTILITGYSSCYKNRSQAVEIFATLPKPFSVDELANTVDRALLKT